MFLIAVSGGPDSIFLLNKYKKKKVVVAHVNYQKRKDANFDQNLVIDFCQKHNLKYEILTIKSQNKKNFQNGAREVRYQFFAKVYAKYNCKMLLTAHHKDDFLETALGQQNSKRNVNFFGIKKRTFIYEMKIKRPLIDSYGKDQILDYLNQKKIKYAIDTTNFEPIYTRNKIRQKIAKLSLREKTSYYEGFFLSNKILIKKTKKIEKLYNYGKKQNFDLEFLNHQTFKHDLVYKFLHTFVNPLKLSSLKLDNIVIFCQSKNQAQKFKLNDKGELVRKDSFLSLNRIKENQQNPKQ